MYMCMKLSTYVASSSCSAYMYIHCIYICMHKYMQLHTFNQLLLSWRSVILIKLHG